MNKKRQITFQCFWNSCHSHLRPSQFKWYDCVVHIKNSQICLKIFILSSILLHYSMKNRKCRKSCYVLDDLKFVQNQEIWKFAIILKLHLRQAYTFVRLVLNWDFIAIPKKKTIWKRFVDKKRPLLSRNTSKSLQNASKTVKNRLIQVAPNRDPFTPY